MDTKEYIESGILELYVYGQLTETENVEVNQMEHKYPEIKDEIVAIEKAIINLSAGFSPFLSSDNFEKIKTRLELKHSRVISMHSRNNRFQYMGWAAALILLVGIGYEYNKVNQTKSQLVSVEVEKSKMHEALVSTEMANKKTSEQLAVIRDVNNTVVNLAGQAVSSNSYAKVYYNKQTQIVYVDAGGLPQPPQGMVYQVWALKLNPLTPTSIGLLDNFSNDKLFAVSKANGAEAFGITLEPAGGSNSPTMEQLYTLGKV